MKFCADYCEDHLIPALVTSIQKLKLLTSSLENRKKLEIYEKHYKEVSKGVLKYLQISETEYNETRARTTEKGMKRELSREESDSADIEEEEGEDKKKSSVSLVLSSRNKSLEELPTINSKKVETSGKSRPSKFIKGKSKSDGGGAGTDTETDITEFIKDGEILYPRLIKDEISKLDAKLLKAAKKTNNIGGKVVLPSLRCSQHHLCRDYPHPRPPRRRQCLGGKRRRLPRRVRERERVGGADVVRPQALPAEGEEEDPGGGGVRGHEWSVESDGGPGHLQGTRGLSSEGGSDTA